MARLLRCSQGHFVNPARHKECPVCAADPPELQPTFLDFEELPPPPPPQLLGWLVQVEGPQRGQDLRITGSPQEVQGLGTLTYQNRRFQLDSRPLSAYEQVGSFVFVPLCGEHFQWEAETRPTPAVRVDGQWLDAQQAEALLNGLLQLGDWSLAPPVAADELWKELPAHPHLAIGGQSLPGERLEDRPPADLDQLIEIAVQMAWGLAAAHEWGVVHGDVRPANIWLTPRVKIAGFGQLGPDPAYRSPDPSPSIAGDIWSWALTVLFMALGRQSWSDGAEAFEVLDSMRQARIPLPTRLEALLRRCFALDPQARPASLLEVAQELCGDPAPAAGEPGARLYLLVALREAGQQVPKVSSPPDPLKEFEEARQILERLVARRPELEPMLAGLCRREAALREPATALRLYDRAQTLLLKLVHARGKAERTRELAEVCMAKAALLGYGEDAGRLYEQGMHLLERLPGDAAAQLALARARLKTADFERRNLRLAEAQAQLQQCQVALGRLLEQGYAVESEQAEVHFQQGGLLAERGDRSGALAFYDAAIALWGPLVDRRGEEWPHQAAALASAWLNKAAALAEGLDFRSAVEQQQKALHLLEDVVFRGGHQQHVELWATACVEQADSQNALGEHSRALTLLNQAVTTLERLVAEGRSELAPQWAQAMVKRAVTVAHSGAAGGAVALLDETIAKLQLCPVPEVTPFLQLAERERAAVAQEDEAAPARQYLEKARRAVNPAEAARHCKEAVGILKSLAERENRPELLAELAGAQAHYGRALEAARDFHGAFKTYEEARKWLEPAVHHEGQTHLTDALACTYFQLARIHQEVGQLEASREALERSVSLWEHLVNHGQEECRPALGRALISLGLLDPAQLVGLRRGCELLEQPEGLSVEDGALLAQGWLFLARMQRHQGQPDGPLCQRAAELCRQLPDQAALLAEVVQEGKLHNLFALAAQAGQGCDLRNAFLDVVAAHEQCAVWTGTPRLAALLKDGEQALGRSFGTQIERVQAVSRIMSQFCEVVQHG